MFYAKEIETAGRDRLTALQGEKLRSLIATLYGRNRFYTEKLQAAGVKPDDIRGVEDIARLPFTRKDELVRDQKENPEFGTNLTFPQRDYVRVHQTSGTTGQPLRWLDTAESWDWWGTCWAYVFSGAGITAGDRVFVAFSFAPFIGFWAAVEGIRKIGAMLIPGGGLSTRQRVESILQSKAAAVVCTPTYALRMAEEAREMGMDLAKSDVRVTIHAGEPGANIPSTKRRIGEAWGAGCMDHTGATEVGAFGFEDLDRPGGVFFSESEFICEVLDPNGDGPVGPGVEGELVITNLGRACMPVIRYRSGDLVRPSPEPCPTGRTFAWAEGGILGRVDDMFIVRGVNIYPSAIENIVRECKEVSEFRIEVETVREMAELALSVECTPGVAADPVIRRLSEEVHSRLGVRVLVSLAEPGTLPRFELKARRLQRKN
ncbi:MAG: phenylacetate--CoA ligase family protein [Nitrospinota bacterium]